MIGLNDGQVERAPPAPTSANRQVHLLEIDEEPLIEPTQCFEDRATNEKERAHDLIDFPVMTVVPFHHEMRRKRRWQNSVESDHLRQEWPRCGKSSARASDGAIGIQKLDTCDSNRLILWSVHDGQR